MTGTNQAVHIEDSHVNIIIIIIIWIKEGDQLEGNNMHDVNLKTKMAQQAAQPWCLK